MCKRVVGREAKEKYQVRRDIFLHEWWREVLFMHIRGLLKGKLRGYNGKVVTLSCVWWRVLFVCLKE